MKILWLLLGCAASILAAPELDGLKPRLEKALYENIAGFWYPRSIDKVNGGYTINYGPRGEDRGPGNRGIVTQSRMVWFFARMARFGYRKPEMLAAAGHGYRFLREKLWDPRHGGFYWEVEPGGKVVRDGKHLYGQAFALYAVSEYGLASGDQEAREFAIRFFELLESKAHDGKHGGYHEFFAVDWSPPPAGAQSYLGGAGAGSVKLMNTHLHILEALTTFYRATAYPKGRQRLFELITIETGAVLRIPLGACTDRYQPDWTPIIEPPYDFVSYGHDLENVWLVADALRALDLPVPPYVEMFRQIWDYSLRYGYDAANGGFYYTGQLNQPASNREKSWWVQAEVLVSALEMYHLTRDQKYLAVFLQTWRFLDEKQIDWENGEWHSSVREDGQVAGPKASLWKAAYHNGRALIEILTRLPNL